MKRNIFPSFSSRLVDMHTRSCSLCWFRVVLSSLPRPQRGTFHYIIYFEQLVLPTDVRSRFSDKKLIGQVSVTLVLLKGRNARVFPARQRKWYRLQLDRKSYIKLKSVRSKKSLQRRERLFGLRIFFFGSTIQTCTNWESYAKGNDFFDRMIEYIPINIR